MTLLVGSLNDEAANHHIVARLDKRTRGDVTQRGWNKSVKFKGTDVARTIAQISTLITRWRIRIVPRIDRWTVRE